MTVVLWNFRADRMVSISQALEYPDFSVFDRERVPQVRMWQCVCPTCVSVCASVHARVHVHPEQVAN